MVYKLLVMISPFSLSRCFLWPSSPLRQWEGFNIWWRRRSEEVKLALRGFPPGLNVSPGYKEESIKK